jgi:hypothetical protein
MSEENWLPICGYEGLYEVSNLGRIRSLPRMVGSRWGKGKKPVPGKLKKPTQKPLDRKGGGYWCVHLYANCKFAPFFVHRLVAEHFIPNPDELPQVNHKDGDKANNAASNLEWMTAQENCRHALAEGLYEQARGEDCGNAKVTEADVVDIRRLVAGGMMHKEAAELYGIGRKAVTKIVNRQRWKHVA